MSGGSGGMTNPLTTTGDIIYSSSGTTPARLAAPAAGKFLTGAGTSTAPAWGQGPLTTTGDLMLGATGGTPTRLAIGSSSTVLTSNGTTAAWAAAAGGGGNRYVFVLGSSTPTTTSGTWTPAIDVAYQFASYSASAGAQNNSIDWEVLLESGTYSLDLMHIKGTNRGIYTIKLDTSSVGTLDGYNGGGTANATSTLASIAVSTTAIHTIQFIMATKNGSSSSYFGLINGFSMTRTGA